MATIATIELTRATNFRENLLRIFRDWGIQAHVARDSGIHFVHLAKILSGETANPTIGTIESIAVALEIPVETLLCAHPADTDLKIFGNRP